MKIAFLLIGILCAIGGGALRAGQTETSIRVPKGNAITLDGKVTDEEWKPALRQELSGGGEVRLMHDGAYLLVGVKGTSQGLGHLYVSVGQDIYVLHASAALGAAIYRRDAGGVWQPAQTFKWEMRDQSQSAEALVARAAYLKSNGWVASTIGMGNPNELEFKLAGNFKQGDELTLAVVYGMPPGAPRFWPKTVADDCLKQQLIFGQTPPGLQFKPASWARVRWQ